MSSKEIVPVIIFHEGCPKHLPYSVKSAERYNERVILLGNEENRHVAKEHLDTKSLDLTRYKEFEKVFVNYSTYTEFFNLICFKRYFLIYETMKKLGLSCAVMAESDLYNCANYSEIPALKNAYAMVSTTANQESNFGWSSCCHCSFWTLESLDNFLDFCQETFASNRELLKQKWDYHQANNLAGGVCDMTLVYLWSRNNPRVLNSAKLIDGCTIDQNICDPVNFESDEYRYNKLCRIKKYKIKKDAAGKKELFLVKQNGELVKVYSVHCSGRGKEALMRFDKGYGSVCFAMAMALIRVRLGAIKNKLLKK